MKFKNPNFVEPVDSYTQKTLAFISEKKAEIQLYIDGLPVDQETIDFDEVRAYFTDIADKLTDGMIHQILIDLDI